MSSASSDSDDDVEAYSSLSALDSSAALILVHDQDEPTSPLDFTEDEDDLIDDDELVSPMFEVRKSAAFRSLSPSSVFLLLLAPFLRLGALNLPNTQLPLKYGLPALLLSALASAFARQIWYMLARYVRKADMTDILLDTFAKGRGKERQRNAIRNVIRICNGSINLLLAITYLRFSIYTLHPLVSEQHHPVISYFVLTLTAGVLVAYLAFAGSLGSKRVAYTSWLSVATYVGWMGCTIYAHKQGLLEVGPGLLGSGSVWLGIGMHLIVFPRLSSSCSISATAFTFCSSSTLPLYASLKSRPHPISTGKAPLSRSFRLLSFSSVIIAVLLLLPSVIFSASPNHPAMLSLSFAQQTNPTPVDNSTSTIQIQTVPPLPSLQFNINRACTILIVLLLSLIPPRTFPSREPGTGKHDQGNVYLFSSGLFAFLTLLMFFMTLLGTYTVPAVVHILIHSSNFGAGGSGSPNDDDDAAGNAQASSSRQPNPRNVYDELLLRKERALQKKQFRKRIVWDIGVWLLLGASLFVIGGFARTMLIGWS
ncbi:hypothetical protein CPB84DRAFT_1803853 [Gymnopilus junonius]|uniref:Uncharacterized protein n=1 Tax=Gymnopilus junonius TaxID=109634 RepID=A0A9P5N6S0_GYMJU|nr:hypothetical protein CPB84DRAFT_1803853 [Gymnopilus junonius]